VLRSVKLATARKLDLETDTSLHLSSVKMNIEHPAETDVCFLLVVLNIETARHYLSDDSTFHGHCCENLEYNKSKSFMERLL
jgi:hypothetical protein